MPEPSLSDLQRLRRHNRIADSIERGYTKAVALEKNRFIEAVADHYAFEGYIPEQMQEQHRRNMFAIGSKYNAVAIKTFALDNKRNISKSIRYFYETKQGLFEKWLATLTVAWINEHTATAAKQSSKTTVDDVRDAILKSTEQGETLNANVAQRILRVKGLTPFRASTIARTETHNAAMYANKASAERLSRETGVGLLKYWIPAEDGRTRDNHRAMAGHEPIVMESLFQVGSDRMDRPGDPRGSAANVINCRCTLGYQTLE